MKKVLTVVFCLALCTFMLCACSSEVVKSTASVDIELMDGTTKTVDMDLINSLNVVEITTEQSTSESDAEVNVSKGVLLSEVLTKIGVDIDKVNELEVSATDGFISMYNKEQLLDENKLYLIFEQDGEVLNEGGDDVFYIIAGDEQFKQNWTKYVESIKIQ